MVEVGVGVGVRIRVWRRAASSTRRQVCSAPSCPPPQLESQIRTCVISLRFRLQENQQRATVLQQEREYYSSQAHTLQQSLSQLTADKQQTEAELKVRRRRLRVGAGVLAERC